MDVPAEAVKFCNDQLRAVFLGELNGFFQDRPLIERVVHLTGFDLNELLHENPVAAVEVIHYSGALGLQPQT